MLNILGLLIWVVPTLIIVGIIIIVVLAVGKHRGGLTDNKNWYLKIFLSRENALCQLFFLLAAIFLSLTLLAFNRDLGDPLSWRTIIFFSALVAFIGGYYFKALYSITLGLLGLIGWWAIQAVEWMVGRDDENIGLLVGLSLIALLLYVLGRIHDQNVKMKRLASIYSLLGLISITAILFFESTKPGLDVLGELTSGSSIFASWQIAISAFFLLLALGASLFYCLNKKLISATEAGAIVILAIFFSIIAFVPEQNMFANRVNSSKTMLSSAGILWAVIFNILLFLELLGIIFLGYYKRENRLINLGAILFFLLIVVKYFDWFFTFLDKSLFFIGAGILLFVVGFLMEKGRRRIISAIKYDN